MAAEKIRCWHCGLLIVRCEERHDYSFAACHGWYHKAHGPLFGHGCGNRDRNMKVAFPAPESQSSDE
jgi:hypothetical protein